MADAAVLVVDDNDMSLKVAARLLKRRGIEAELAHSGEECIDIVRTKRYDLILMDHLMPGMDGIEALTAMKADRLIPNETAVVMVSGSDEAGIREVFLNAGFYDRLSKPIEPSALEELLNRIFP